MKTAPVTTARLPQREIAFTRRTRADRAVVAIGCARFDDAHRSSGKVDRLLLKTMSGLSLKAQILGGKAASILATR
jgi:hypothetical protein